MSSDTVYTLTPVAVRASIPTGDQLQAPSNVVANYSESSKTLVVNFTIALPQGVTPSNVTLQQFYSADLGLQFYVVYNFPTPPGALYTFYPCQFTALSKDANNNPIPLATISQILTLIQDIDPKTSRGTSTSVNHTKGF